MSHSQSVCGTRLRFYSFRDLTQIPFRSKTRKHPQTDWNQVFLDETKTFDLIEGFCNQTIFKTIFVQVSLKVLIRLF